MENRTFDRFTQSFAGGTRRRVLRGLLGAGAAAVVGTAAPAPGAAARRCRRRDERCRSSTNCCRYPEVSRCDEATRTCIRCLPEGTAVPKGAGGIGCEAGNCCSNSCLITPEGGVCE